MQIYASERGERSFIEQQHGLCRPPTAGCAHAPIPGRPLPARGARASCTMSAGRPIAPPHRATFTGARRSARGAHNRGTGHPSKPLPPDYLHWRAACVPWASDGQPSPIPRCARHGRQHSQLPHPCDSFAGVWCVRRAARSPAGHSPPIPGHRSPASRVVCWRWTAGGVGWGLTNESLSGA